MPSQYDTLSILVVLEFVVMATFVVVVAPFEVAAPLVPLLFLFLVAIFFYRS